VVEVFFAINWLVFPKPSFMRLGVWSASVHNGQAKPVKCSLSLNLDMVNFPGKLVVRGILLVALAFLLSVGILVTAGLNDHAEKGDVIVVPGNTVGPDGRPSPRLKARLDAAVRLYRGKQAPLIFVSGGTGKEGFDEAVSMAQYLAEAGIPKNVVVLDSQGIDTEATAKNLATYMKRENLHSALIATQYFHVPRTELALKRHGIQVVGHMHPDFFEVRDFYSIPREVIGYVVYWLRGT
jgi:vancomycin permeability regulator SanA